MAKLIVFNMVSADGFFEGKNRELNWHTVDADFNNFSIAQLEAADTLIFGRVTYELMASYWPTPDVMKNDPIVAEKMNSLRKVVFSTTLTGSDWKNVELHSGNVASVVDTLKKSGQKDIMVLGSGTLASVLGTLNLVDEYRFMISPILLGQGRSLFSGFLNRVPLRLIESRPFASGNVVLRYAPTGI
jgi:dihydrofolate reductase